MAASCKHLRILCKNIRLLNIQQSRTLKQSISCCNEIKQLYPAVPRLPKEDFPKYEKLTEEFKYVEKLLPKTTVPELPKHESYPTPSGWIPPDNEKTKNLPYLVERNKYHNLPVYVKQKGHRGMKVITVISSVHGDVWQLEKDLRDYLEDKLGTDEPILTEVSEVTRKVILKGNKAEIVGKWLLEKGF